MYFQMHFFICTRFAQKSPSRTPRRTGQACPFLEPCLLQAGFARRKKNPPRRTGKALRLGERKKEIARKAAKPQRPPAVRRIGFFCSHPWARSLSRCNEVKSGSPGGTLEGIRIVQWTILARGEMGRWQK